MRCRWKKPRPSCGGWTPGRRAATAPDPLEAPLAALPEWPLGKPDAVLKLPEVQKIPATGVLDYRHIKVANPFKEDVWLSALDVKAGNRKVVHHVILYAKWPGAPDQRQQQGCVFHRLGARFQLP